MAAPQRDDSRPPRTQGLEPGRTRTARRHLHQERPHRRIRQAADPYAPVDGSHRGALGWADGSINAILEGGTPITFGPPGTGKTQVVAKAVQQALDSGHTVLVTSAAGHTGDTGRLVAALRQATEFSRICADMGAEPAALTQFDAAAEALLSSAVTAQARAAGLAQEHFAAVAHSPRSDGGPDSDRAVVDDVVRQFRAEQREE